MNVKCRALASAGIMLAASAASPGSADATVDRTVGPYGASSNLEVLFGTTVLDATDLVSIGAGTVTTGEGATLTINAIRTDNQEFQIFSMLLTGPFPLTTSIALVTATNNAFTSFATMDVKGLRFISSGGPIAVTVSLPSDTTVSFDTVPEPTTGLCLGLGVLLLAGKRRRNS